MKKLLFLLLTGICTLTSKAQHSYMSAPGVGVFCPAKYDASAHAMKVVKDQTATLTMKGLKFVELEKKE